jgi:hypothetical protein
MAYSKLVGLMTIQIISTNCKTDKLQEISNYHCVYVPYIIYHYDIMNSYSTIMQNVLHWHIVDEQSFPIEIPSYPKLWNGSYSFSERYTMSDAIDIVRYVHCHIHIRIVALQKMCLYYKTIFSKVRCVFFQS